MLSRLYISNYAIISEVEVSFCGGLNIITGETGAGKSILIGALGLILGERADSSVLLDKSRKCMVEGWFPHDNRESIQQFFTDNDLDLEAEIILRREIAANGKSRAFINDSPVNLAQLQQLAALLVDLHQQFDTLQLGQDRFQLDILDAVAGQAEARKKYATCYTGFMAARDRWQKLEKTRAESLKEYDYYHFLHTELEEAGFREGELEQLEGELGLLSNAEQVSNALFRLNGVLDADDQPVTNQLKTLAQQMEAIARFHPALQTLAERLRSAQVELKDIAAEAEQISVGISMDARRLDEVQERLSMGYKLLKKHHVKDTAGLLEVHQQIGGKISTVNNLDEEIGKAKAEHDRTFREASDLAGKISMARHAAVAGFQDQVKLLLHHVGMPNARLQVQLESCDLNNMGADRVEFLFDANNSNRFEPLRKVASGGEFSRLLLCIKTLVGGSMAMPLMIFDEIDTGISGEAARQVGILMKEMGRSHQVISITHQPQIAAMADAHYFVFKKEIGGAIRTQLRKLNDIERVEAIARMMSGEKPSESALQNARELMTAN